MVTNVVLRALKFGNQFWFKTNKNHSFTRKTVPLCHAIDEYVNSFRKLNQAHETFHLQVICLDDVVCIGLGRGTKGRDQHLTSGGLRPLFRKILIKKLVWVPKLVNSTNKEAFLNVVEQLFSLFVWKLCNNHFYGFYKGI